MNNIEIINAASEIVAYRPEKLDSRDIALITAAIGIARINEQGKRDAVRHSDWGPAYYTNDGLLRRDCGNCGRAHTELSNFCPHCGARMDGKEGLGGSADDERP